MLIRFFTVALGLGFTLLAVGCNSSSDAELQMEDWPVQTLEMQEQAELLRLQAEDAQRKAMRDLETKGLKLSQ